MTDFWKDFAEAQASMPVCILDSVNPHFKSKFASLASVMRVAHHFMAKGFGITQSIASDGESVRAVTIVTKGETQMISESPSFPVTKRDAQGYASACTYARRIGMQLALGIVGQEDDDANAAVAEPVKSVSQIPPEAKKAAESGRDSFGVYWKGLDAKQRYALKPFLPDLKQLAEAA